MYLQLKKYIPLLIILNAFISCTSEYEEINTDPKKPLTIDAAYLISTTEQKLVDVEQNPSVNWSNTRLFAQYWMQVQYVAESQYYIDNRDINGTIWDYYYILLNDLMDAKAIVEGEREVIPEQEYTNKMAIIKVLESYAWLQLTDFFTDVPYEEALGSNQVIYPKYDDAQSIYMKTLGVLEEVVNSDLSGKAFTSTDIIYKGDMTKWKDFAGSIMMRMAMRIADVDAANSKKYFDLAASKGYIKDIEGEAMFPYKSTFPNANPVFEYWDVTGSNRPIEFNMANTLVDVLNDLEDPRRPFYIDNNLQEVQFDSKGDTLKDADGEVITKVIYKGILYGGASTSFSKYSHIAPSYQQDPTQVGKLFSIVETFFIQSEQAARQGNTTQAQMYYNEGITASMKEWGVEDVDITAYLAQANVDYSTLLSSGKTFKEIIGLQKWIANYNSPFNGWREAIRLGGAPLAPPAEGPSRNIIIQRYTYPSSEQQLNPTNRSTAASRIGGDKLETQMWWQK
ncbi:SusD/RagB family nutrient-binding outer membrane lipoprotein [Flammeovirga kamogawensis]|uniref:SusD/RagB family nutrient-binding outer membrane lipoprotein n=1 Tax=Flammeovirga kamogawensis TaxID=373891 RepID=A0ABX8H452_9BACT|nr:SusD/RagB family nutrient-binding outer membrane lipoprotein [Flammeovirga kamogawensis]QWG10352.1 SusD/RagB family nutrient-binding outer membrane lipoprotein [Flammeovirga kamogawensis]